MLVSETSLGIDICQEKVSIALLSRQRGQFRLLKAAEAAVPEGAMAEGNIRNPALLGGLLKELLRRNKIYLRQAAVSLVAKPTLVRIIDISEEIPGNIGQFVQSEIKHSAVLAGKEPHYDFCGLGGIGPKGPERLFVSATDHEKTSALLKTLKEAGIEPFSIEPPVIAAVRALYDRKIANKFDSNILIALLRDCVMTICVFRKGLLDFIRSIDITDDAADCDGYAVRCKNEINSIIQFYDIEVEETDDKWEIIVEFDDIGIQEAKFSQAFNEKFDSQAQICSASTIYSDTNIAENTSIKMASVTAVGLAMKHFGSGGANIDINLVPPEAEEKKARKKFLLINANIAAVILLFVFLIAGIVGFRFNATDQEMESRVQNNLTTEIEKLLSRQRILNHEISYLSDKKSSMDGVFGAAQVHNWPRILNDIRQRTPVSLCITTINCSGNTELEIAGNALAYKSIHIFAELLGMSEFIKSALVAQTNKDYYIKGLIAYSIKCVLQDNSGLQANANQ